MLHEGCVTEELAILMHRLLKAHPESRSKWLSGLPLRRALLETPWQSVQSRPGTPLSP
jgi:hypothetical protein